MLLNMGEGKNSHITEANATDLCVNHRGTDGWLCTHKAKRLQIYLRDVKVSTMVQAAADAISQEMVLELLPPLLGQKPCKC